MQRKGNVVNSITFQKTDKIAFRPYYLIYFKKKITIVI